MSTLERLPPSLRRGPWARLAAPLTALALAAALGACKPAPESTELVELEALILDPGSQGLRDNASAQRFFQEARQFRRLAREAHQESKPEVSREYAILGTLRYRTAVAMVTQFQAKSRLDAANARVEALNPQLASAAQERDALNRRNQELEQRISEAVRLQAQQSEERYQQTLQGATYSEQQRERQKAIALANRQIDELRREADNLRAGEFAPKAIALAQDQLSAFQRTRDIDPDALEAQQQQVENAVALYRQAIEQTRPRFEAFQRRMQPEARIQALRTQARDVFGAPFVFEEPEGVRIVMARLFEPQSPRFQFNTDAALKALGGLTGEFAEFTVFVEGHTARSGKPSQSVELSASRAQAVRDWLVQSGLAAERFRTDAAGHERPRYRENPEDNDRVEIVISIKR